MSINESNNLRVLIADDEMLARALVKEYLQAHPDLMVVGEAENGLEALQIIEQQRPQLIFLDIQMPQLTGLEVLELSGVDRGVILTTAFDQYALKAFDLHAIDYLLKPFTQVRFDEAVNKARRQMGQPDHALNQLLKHPKQAMQTLHRLVIKERQQVAIIEVNAVDYVEAQDDYINIHSNGKAHLKTQSLSELEAQLDAQQFVRIHRSYLLNLNALKNIEKQNKDTHVAHLHCGASLPISRAGYERIKAFLAPLRKPEH